MADRSWYEGILQAVDDSDADRFASYEVPVEFCNVFHMRGDKIRSYRIYIDPTPVTAAAEAA